MLERGRLTTHATQAHHRRPGIYLHIYVILNTTDRGVISVSEPQRWRARNNREFYQQVLGIHERSHSRLEWAFVWLGSAAEPVQSELSHEARTVDTPWRRKRRAQARVGASRESCECLVLLKRQAKKAGKGWKKLSLAAPTSPIQAFTGKIFTNDSELPQTMFFTSSACYL